MKPDGPAITLPYLSTMCMGDYLRYVIAPAFKLDNTDKDTVFARVHSHDLRVVFNNECTSRQLKEFLADGASIIVSPWVEIDHATCRSLKGNVHVKPEELK